MKKVVLFAWITLIVVLHVAADIDPNDYSGLCEKCDEDNVYPECSMDNSRLQFNLTIHCQKSIENNCTLGIVETVEADDSNRIIAFVCQLRESNMDLLVNELEMDDIQVLSTVESHSIAKETTTQKLMELNYDEKDGTNTEDNVNVRPTTKVNFLDMTTNVIPIDDQSNMHNVMDTNADPSSSIANEQTVVVATPTVPDRTEPSSATIASEGAVLAAAEQMALDNEIFDQNKQDPEVSLSVNSPDYQGDEPKVEIQAAVHADHNDIPALESNALDIESIKQTENITVTQMTNTEMEANAFETSTRSGGVISSMQKCFTCSSSNDANCIRKPEKQTDCKTMDGIKNGCYTLFKESVLQRGCSSDLQVNELKSCLSSSSTKCRMCDGPSCNKDPWPQCYNCSSNDDPECAWWREGAEKVVAQTLCTDFGDQCLSSVDASGITRRICANANVTCSNEPEKLQELCEVCSTHLCNAGVFPAIRRHCLQCTGTNECATTKDIKGMPCLLYKPNDRCFLYANDSNQMIRGCASASAEFQRCHLIGGSTKCKTCAEPNNCNNTPLMIAPKLSCSRCDNRHQISMTNNEAEKDDTASACAWAQSTETMVKCTNSYAYFMQESCLTIYHPDVEWTVRDCSFDFGACEPTDRICETCSTNGCNAKNMKWQYCLQCNSDMEPHCATDVAKIELKKCPASVQPYELRGCYTKIDAESNITTRGCISDLTEDGMTFCKNKTKLCTLCYENGCNNRLAVSEANSMIKHQIILVFEMFFATIFFNNYFFN